MRVGSRVEVEERAQARASDQRERARRASAAQLIAPRSRARPRASPCVARLPTRRRQCRPSPTRRRGSRARARKREQRVPVDTAGGRRGAADRGAGVARAGRRGRSVARRALANASRNAALKRRTLPKPAASATSASGSVGLVEELLREGEPARPRRPRAATRRAVLANSAAQVARSPTPSRAARSSTPALVERALVDQRAAPRRPRAAAASTPGCPGAAPAGSAGRAGSPPPRPRRRWGRRRTFSRRGVARGADRAAVDAGRAHAHEEAAVEAGVAGAAARGSRGRVELHDGGCSRARPRRLAVFGPDPVAGRRQTRSASEPGLIP